MIWGFWTSRRKIQFSLTFLISERAARFSVLFLRPERKNFFFFHCHFWTVSKRTVFFSHRGEFRFKMRIFRTDDTVILTHVHRDHTKEMQTLFESGQRANSERRRAKLIRSRGLPQEDGENVPRWRRRKRRYGRRCDKNYGYYLQEECLYKRNM